MSLKSLRKSKEIIKPKVLYHGSSIDIKDAYIKPGKFNRISATPDMEIAMLHTVKGVGDLNRTQISYEGLFGAKRHTLRMSGQDIENLKKPGWIYIVDTEPFELPKTITVNKGDLSKIEWDANKKVRIIKKIRVPSLYDYMKKHPNKIKIMHKRGPLARWAMYTIIGPFVATNMTANDIDEYVKKCKNKK